MGHAMGARIGAVCAGIGAVCAVIDAVCAGIGAVGEGIGAVGAGIGAVGAGIGAGLWVQELVLGCGCRNWCSGCRNWCCVLDVVLFSATDGETLVISELSPMHKENQTLVVMRIIELWKLDSVVIISIASE